MSKMEAKDRLISDLTKIDNVISAPMAAVSTAMSGIALALLLADIIFQISTNYVALSLMVTSLCIAISARYSSNQAKRVVLESHGLRCGNCKKTPQPGSIYRWVSNRVLPTLAIKIFGKGY